MLFKNAFIYRFTRPVPWSREELESALNNHPFAPCNTHEHFRQGWVAPSSDHDEALAFAQGKYVLITLNKEEKILPASVINEEVKKRAAVIEAKEQRKLRKKEKQEIKELVLTVLLPKAFTKSKKTSAFVDMQEGLLILDVSSSVRADDFTSFLRQTVGSLPIQLITAKESPSGHFSRWVAQDNYPAPFTSGDQCDLRAAASDDMVIRCKGTESLTEAVANHIEAGLRVTQIGLSWDDKVSFVLDEDLTVKRIKYLDTFHDNAAAGEADAEAQFQANFSLLTLEMSKMVVDILASIGGEDQSTVIAG